MAAPLRVHTLAKELGVESKDVISKCKAEGIELKNHMAVISLGLAESIREWFSSAADITSVESADPVDLKVVKRKPRKKKADGDSSVAVEEPPADDLGDTEETAQDESPAIAPTEPATETPAEPDVRVTEPVAAPIAVPSEPEPIPTVIPMPAPPEPAVQPMPMSPAAHGPSVESTPVSKPAPPAPPSKPVIPAGPQLVPKPAALQGPRVVRIEAPEPVSRPRPRPPGPYIPGPSPMLDRPSSPGGGGAAPARGKGRGTRADEEAAARKTARSPRRHDRGEEVVERIKEWRDQDVLERQERLAHATGQGLRARRSAEARRHATSAPSAPGKKSDVEITAPIMLREFCSAVGTPFAVISRKLMEHTGQLHRINDILDHETAEMLIMDLGLNVRVARARTALESLEHETESRERANPKPRPPVVAMLGHVDHGKTSLLDAIRRTNVAKGEAGGITQRIGAYRIDRGEWHVTFLDTPGHEAFTAMRARGANLTDVVVLVVAADDGVMPQTVEAINHAKAAGVHIVVALNKIDIPGADTNRIYGQLAEHGVVVSEWGGNVDVLKTSATKGVGIDELIAHLSTLTELMDLKADPSVPANGIVIEAHMQEGRGVAAQVLIREGTLKVGQHVVCGAGSGRVRSLIDDRGNRMQSAGPATPVEVGGLDALPQAGDKLYVVEDATQAKEIAAEVAARRRTDSLAATRKHATLEDLLRGKSDGELPELNVILKADGQSRVDVLRTELGKIPAAKAKLRILHAGVGAISEADVALAKASGAVVFGFDVVAEDRAKSDADASGVEVRVYRVIYELLDDVRKAMEGLLEPEYKQETRAKVEVRQIFNVSKVGVIAGCAVLDGTIARNHKVRLVRDGRIVVDNASLDSLKRFKDDAKEVRSGLECGIKIAGYDDVKPGDIIESYEMIEKRRSLV